METHNQTVQEQKLTLDVVEKFILGTLLYTPQFYARNEKYVEIKAYAPGYHQPAMKIFRMIFRCSPLSTTPVDMQEIAFQDEIDVLTDDGHRDSNQRWQINFSILVDKESYEYKSILERPKTLTGVLKSIEVFTSLSTQTGATLYAGDWRFESDGSGWIPADRSRSATQLTSVLLALPY